MKAILFLRFSDRILERLAPKTTAAAFACDWQYECRYEACSVGVATFRRRTCVTYGGHRRYWPWEFQHCGC